MKTKKKSKRKNACPRYTPGRNAFGQKAKTELIILERETALQQITECLIQLKENKIQEFTFDWSSFDGYEDEMKAITEKVNALMALKAMLSGVPYFNYSLAAS